MNRHHGSSRRKEALIFRRFKVSLLTSAATISLVAHAALPPPRSPVESLSAIHTKSNLIVELAASEPAVMDPVAIDWDARGRLWVVEQPDYPNGMDGNWKPGGRVKILTSTRGDGHYDKATLFIEGIPFPTGITCWRNGVLICAAPDVLYAEDTDGDGKADVLRKLFTGFETDNYNARINSLALGLDNWIHGANGLRGGKIRSEKTGVVTDISGRDIRIQPDTGELQLVSGVTQQGRVRDDSDNWFGCSNSRWIFHFPLPDHYVRRNPHVPAPASLVYLPADENAAALNPVSHTLERWNSPDAQGHITSACGLGIYRDSLLGPEFYGNAFIGEVAHNLVRRFRLDPDGVTFAARRPDDERSAEFFASEDNWSRFVQIRTGPDGALYIVDMYRAVIEHTRWIPADKLKGLDVRAGDTMGRIYRVYPKGAKLRPIPDLTKLDVKQLAAALDTPNGTVRDLVHLQLLHRADRSAAPQLEKLVESGKSPAVRVQALAALEGLQSLSVGILQRALEDKDTQVRRLALRLCEPRFARHPELGAGYLKMSQEPGFQELQQTVLSFGEWDDPQAAKIIGQLAAASDWDSWMRAAVVSSSTRRPLEALKVVLAEGGGKSPAGRTLLIGQLIATAAGQAARAEDCAPLLDVILPAGGSKVALWQIGGLAQLLDALERKKLKLAAVPGGERAGPLFEAALSLAADARSSDASVETALRLLGRQSTTIEQDISTLAGILGSKRSERVQKSALAALVRARSPKTPALLLKDWPTRGPGERQAIVNALISREEWIMQLLDAVEQGTVGVGEVPVASRQALARHSNSGIRGRAAKLLPTGSTDRAAVVARYQSVTQLKGDGTRGATVFMNNCATCHAYLGRGNELGPNLGVFRTKDVADFLVAILDPNAAMDARFTVYDVELKDGRTLTGILTGETGNSLTLGMAGGLKESILRADVARLRASPLSLMPEGLESVLTPQDIADLIVFVKGGG